MKGKNRIKGKYDYNSILKYFKLYEYIYECARKELY